MRILLLILSTFFVVTAVSTQPSAAQQPRPDLPDMQVIANELGVGCEYCHGGGRSGRGRGGAVTPAGKNRLEIAKEMIALTAELNARIPVAVGKEGGGAVRVRCATCHHGVAIPRPLQDIIWQTNAEQGHDAAVTQYRELRARYYGRNSYDFGENTLLVVAERLAEARPDAAIALANLNLEFHPNSARSYFALATAQARKRETATAIETMKKALELDPNNALARGRLYQLEQDLARQQR